MNYVPPINKLEGDLQIGIAYKDKVILKSVSIAAGYGVIEQLVSRVPNESLKRRYYAVEQVAIDELRKRK